MKVIYMKKSFFMILFALIVITIVVTYTVFQFRKNEVEKQKVNNEYSVYLNKTIPGTDLMSLINKTIDLNEKNEVPRDSNKRYIKDNENLIQIYIEFIYKKETRTLQIEDIEKGGTEAFIKNYSTADFKCTSIEYNKDTNKVKSLVFSEISEINN